MRRFLVILLCITGAALGLLLLALIPLTQTPVGIQLADRISRPIIERQVAEQLGSEVSYAPLAGRLPNRIVVRDLELSSEGVVWARAHRFVLRWNSWDLLRGRIKVDEIVLVDGAFLDYPSIPEKTETESPEPGEVTEDEDQGDPWSVDVESLVIRNFVLGAPILGEAYTLSLFGSGAYEAPGLAADLLLQTSEGTDRATLNLLFDGGRLSADLGLVSEENGLLTTLLGSGARTELGAFAEGPLRQLTAEVSATAGIYGELSGQLRGSMDDLNRLSGEVRYKPGSFLPAEAASAIGEQLTLLASGEKSGDELIVSITEFSGAFGTLGGEVRGVLEGARSGSASLTGTIAESVLEPYGAEVLSGALSFTANASESPEGYTYAANLNAGQASLSLREGRTDGASQFAGDLRLAVRNLAIGDERLDPILRDGVEVTTGLRYTDDRFVLVEGLKATLGTLVGNRIIASGDARYGVESGSLSTDLSLRVGAQALSQLIGQGEFDAPLTVALDADGTLENLALKADAQIPSGRIEENRFASGRLRTSITALPGTPTGTVELTSSDESYSGRSAFKLDGKDLTLSALTFSAGGLALEGSAAANLETLEGDASLIFSAARGTRLITGEEISGDLNLRIKTAAELALIDAEVTAERLHFDESDVGSLNLTVRGPKSAVVFDLAARDITAGSLFLTDAESRGVLDLGDGSSARVDALRLMLPGKDQTIELKAPTTIAWGDGVAISPTELSYLGSSDWRLEGSFKPDRWRAEVHALKVPLIDKQVFADFDLSLDTEKATPGVLTLVALGEANDNPYTLKANATWDGFDANIEANLLRGDDEALGTIAASVPLQLARGPSLAVSVPERELSGAISYADRLEPIFAFLPVEAQPITGRLGADVVVSGTPAKPQASGELRLEDARYEDSTVGITLRKLNGGVTFRASNEGTRGEVNFTGSGASGRDNAVRLSGTVAIEEAVSDVNLRLVLDKAQLADSPELELRMSSDLRLTGDLQTLRLAGPSTIDELDLTIPEIEAGDNVPSYAPVNVVRVDGAPRDQVVQMRTSEAPPVTIELALTVKADDGIFVRGRGLESEWSADLAVEGSAEKPRIGGDISIVEGEINLAGRAFELDRGTVGFQRTEDIDPLIDVEASTEAGEGSSTVTAIASISGRASNPTIGFRSNPSLPEEDVLALILFGRPARDLGASEALQLAQAAATLSGALGGGAGVGGALRSGLGLDRLSFDPTARALEVGKYVSEDIYVSARQSLTQAGTIISVVYELSRFLSLETTLQPNGAQSVGASYRRDY